MNDVSIEMIPESDTIEQIGYSYHDFTLQEGRRLHYLSLPVRITKYMQY